MKTLLVNLYGAPCSGKSVKMMQLAVVGKMRRAFCEVCPEVAKEYVVQHIEITGEIQWNLTREQLRRLHCFVGHVGVVVTDAPVMFGAFYAGYRGFENAGEMERVFAGLAGEVSAKAEAVVNVYLWRDHPYEEAGRLECEREDEEIARRMWAFVRAKHAGEVILEAKSTDEAGEVVGADCGGGGHEGDG